MALKQPMGQKLLTNVSVVILKQGGLKFEIAAYPNMVTAWRNKNLTDLSEVLQIDRVYKDVEKGEYAKTQDLKKAFGTTDQEQICIEILKKGEVQLSEKERGAQQESLMKEICSIVAEKCVNPQSKRPVTVGVVERALHELHFNPNITKPAKKQALEAIKLLEGKYPIERAPMRLKLTFPLAQKDKAKEQVKEVACGDGDILEREEESGSLWTVIIVVHPEKYRDADKIVQEYRTDGGTMEVLQLSVHKEGDAAIESHRDDSPSHVRAVEDSNARASSRQPPAAGAKSDGFKCSTAPGMEFATREEMTAHMKSDWHKHNLKLKSESKPMLTKEQFIEYQLMTGK